MMIDDRHAHTYYYEVLKSEEVKLKKGKTFSCAALV